MAEDKENKNTGIDKNLELEKLLIKSDKTDSKTENESNEIIDESILIKNEKPKGKFFALSNKLSKEINNLKKENDDDDKDNENFIYDDIFTEYKSDSKKNEEISDTNQFLINSDNNYIDEIVKTNLIENDDEDNEDEGKGTFSKDFFEFIETVVFSIVFVILVFTFIGRNVVVDGDSMQNTLHNGDLLIISNLTNEYNHGDIVVFIPNHAGNDPVLKKPFIKRVIALENETIEVDYDNNIVKVNGEVINEPYIRDAILNRLGNRTYPYTVPENQVFVMGDNRNNSRDSRYLDVGTVDKRTIMGKVLFRLFPFNKIGVIE